MKNKKEAEKKEKEERRKIENFLDHYKGKRTFGQKSSDALTKWAGSWAFILGIFFFLALWMSINAYLLVQYHKGEPFDPYPFILLNLILSCLAAVQAPIILMSQNRQSQRDRLKAEYDYRINKKAEQEIREIKNLLRRRRRNRNK